MTKPTKDARTFSEWWNSRYAREHYLVGVLLGLLLGALIGLAFREVLLPPRPGDGLQAADAQRPSEAVRPATVSGSPQRGTGGGMTAVRPD